MNMKFCLLLLSTIALPLSVGCEPRPIVEQPPVVEEPAVDVNVNPTTPPATDPTTNDEKADVDVQIGGGQGVQVDVDAAPQQ
jgi:hypothetical protein